MKYVCIHVCMRALVYVRIPGRVYAYQVRPNKMIDCESFK